MDREGGRSQYKEEGCGAIKATNIAIVFGTLDFLEH